MKKALKWLGITVLLLLVLPLVVVIAINAFDEKVDPQAARYGEPRAPGVPDVENGYYAMLAMGADDGADAMAYAIGWVAESRAAAKNNRAEKRADVKRARRPVLCDSPQASCLDGLRGKAAQVKTDLDAYADDLARYENLIAFKRYEDVLDYPVRLSAALPLYSPMMDGQKAHLMRAALAADASDFGSALDAIERDLVFHRVMLAGSRTLHGQAIAATGYVRDLAFIADMLRVHRAAMGAHVQRLRGMLQAIDAKMLRITPVVESEFAVAKNLMRYPLAYQGEGRQTSRAERIGIHLFYKPNTTINRAYQQFVSAAAATSAPAQSMAAAFQAARQSPEKMGLWDTLNNPIGKSVLRAAEPDFGAYALRLHDLDAYNRLIGLWVEMIAVGVHAEGTAEFLAKSEPRFHDPYTQKPMRWDAGEKRVYFEAQGTFTKRRTDGVDNGRVFITP